MVVFNRVTDSTDKVALHKLVRGVSRKANICYEDTEETRIERDTYTPLFITTLFIIARTWKQPRCSSVDE